MAMGALKHRFLYPLPVSRLVVVDIAKYGLPPQIRPEAERYFLASGANTNMIEEASAWLHKCSAAVLTVV